MCVAKHVNGENHQRNPDDDEPNPPRRRHRLFQHKHTEAKRKYRRRVLNESDCREWQTTRGSREEHQRDGRDRASGHNPECVGNAVNERRHADGAGHDEPLDNREWGHPHRFDHQATDGVHVGSDALFNEAVETERERQSDGNPGESVVTDRQHNDGDGTHSDGNPLHAAQALAQYDDTQDDGDDGVDEIAEG